ncbi:MAG: hypothetical protein BMS9Abin24_071 [Thermodesulfobacteriota bacterium]|nr:MAG: hypothetical protein BMS9Abin24_071 [Thermodesulfobacteriota bacterium]
MKYGDKGRGVTLQRALAAGAAAGLAGGLAEVLFMGAYSSIAGIDPSGILRLITFTFFDSAVAFGPNGLMAGLLIHFALSLAIGVSFSLFARFAFRGSFSYSRALLWSSLALTAIWAVNFFVVLPVYNAPFVQLVRPEVGFFSKLSFGVVLALGLRYAWSAAPYKALDGLALMGEGA